MEVNNRQFPSDNETLSDQLFLDLLYSYLQAESEWSGIIGEPRFIYKKKINKEELFQLTQIKKSAYYNRIAALRSKGFLIEEADRFILPILEPGRYHLIPKETLTYLINTASTNVIKVYTILGKRYNGWLAAGTPTDNPVIFTLEYLARGLGYANARSATVRGRLVDILSALTSSGLIVWENKYKFDADTGNTHQYKELYEVRTTVIRDFNSAEIIASSEIPELELND